jgi:predicted  nucleic acid-binding Zn-ribbon protein
MSANPLQAAEALRTERNELEGEKAKLGKDISTLDAAIRERDDAIAELDRKQHGLRGELDQAKQSLDKEKTTVASANIEITKLQQILKVKENEIDNLKEALGNRKTEFSNAEGQLQDVREENPSLQQKLRASIQQRAMKQQYLSPQEETALVSSLLGMMRNGYLFSAKFIRNLAYDMALQRPSVSQIPATDRSNVLSPEKNYPQAFFKRYPELKTMRMKIFLNNLGDRVGGWFQNTGSLRDLEEVIGIGRQLVAAGPADHPDLAENLNNGEEEVTLDEFARAISNFLEDDNEASRSICTEQWRRLQPAIGKLNILDLLNLLTTITHHVSRSETKDLKSWRSSASSTVSLGSLRSYVRNNYE